MNLAVDYFVNPTSNGTIYDKPGRHTYIFNHNLEATKKYSNKNKR